MTDTKEIERLQDKIRKAISALEALLNSGIVQQQQFYGHAEAIFYAQKILEDLRQE